ncbi:MAG TPA: HD domain-containing protein [Kofleriaceae bacterium]|nr:HD domain-containing protein [Kofleriaceae bacterium]
MDRLSALARERTPGRDPAHDWQHCLRVAGNARAIAAEEGARGDVVVPAALLHELFNYPKDHEKSSESGDECARLAEALLDELGWAPDVTAQIAYCIRVHSFSRGIRPETLEAKVLQDADRLDAIGAIGIARCFATCQAMQRPFYDPADPFCAERAPDDKRWGVDHFYRKLNGIAASLHTATARAMGKERAQFMERYLAQLSAEIGASAPSSKGPPRA